MSQGGRVQLVYDNQDMVCFKKGNSASQDVIGTMRATLTIYGIEVSWIQPSCRLFEFGPTLWYQGR